MSQDEFTPADRFSVELAGPVEVTSTITAGIASVTVTQGPARRRFPRGTPWRERIEQDPASGCWLWLGAINSSGYGSVGGNGEAPQPVHRFVYKALVGPIPEGMQIDHLCKVKTCCNPAHLEVVSPSENFRRSDGPAARNLKKTHCIRGHEFTPENTLPQRTANGTIGRDCRACRRLRRLGQQEAS